MPEWGEIVILIDTMLDIKFIKENADLIKEAARKKHVTFNLDDLISVDNKRLLILSEIEALRAKQNASNGLVARATSEGEKSRILHEMKLLKDDLTRKEDEYKELVGHWRELMLTVPNIPDISVPEGASDAENVEVRTWGTIPEFSFEPKSHIELMQKHDMLDLERGTKVAGFRGYFLKNDGARLQYALWSFVQDFFNKKQEFIPMIVPSLVRREVFMGTGYLPQGEDDLYRTQDNEYLAGTAEVATMGYFMDEIVDKKSLPMKMISFSPCFRREAGSHGKDTKGLIRVHEFYKFEQVVLCEASHEESVKHHEEITKYAEEMLQALEIPYHVVANCGGDLGLGQVKKYDIEAWLPSEGKYRETNSASYFHDFQTRRLNIRYKDDDGKLKFVHSLNNTAMSGRPLIMIIENYQQADGTIKVPKVLVSYMGKEIIGN